MGSLRTIVLLAAISYSSGSLSVQEQEELRTSMVLNQLVLQQLMETMQTLSSKQASNEELMASMVQELNAIKKLLHAQLEATSCPPPFTMVGDDCLVVNTKDLTWQAARAHCQSIGADLAVPQNLTQVSQYIADHYYRLDLLNIWLGGAKVEGSEHFHWFGGRDVDQTYWWTGGPEGNGDCLALYPTGQQPLDDFPCDMERRSLCQRSLNH